VEVGVEMSMGNFDFDMADLRAEQEREAGIRRAQEAVKGSGTVMCKHCPLPIEPARKAALLSADSCIACARRLDRLRWRRA
jgi:RNA polymerase-binding transcription factor DksA